MPRHVPAARFALVAALAAFVFVPHAARAETRFTAEQAQRDLRVLKRALTTLHPGLYRYRTAADYDSAFARENVRFEAGGTRAELFLAAARLAASVRCGHTWAGHYNQSEVMNREVLDRADKLPVHLALVERRFLVTASAADPVARNSELLAIDGRPVGDLVTELLPYLRADGSNDGKRLAELTHQSGRSAMDDYFPLLHPPGPEGYRLTLRGPGDAKDRTVVAPALAYAARESLLAARGDSAQTSQAWTFRIEGRTAWWEIPTFVFWDGKFDWKGEIARRFAEMRERRVESLVIDLRRNEGGTGEVGDSLLVHLIRQPFAMPASRPESAYERVPYVLARFLDTWDFDFFDRTGKVAKTAGRNYVMTDRDTSAQWYAPVARPFTGRAYVLVGPENSSATFEFARAVKASGAATLVGSETGGSLRGINGGELCWVTLPNSGAAVDVPLIAWMAPGSPPDAGITPDVVVPRRFADVAAGIDPEVAEVRRLISKGPRRPR